MHSCFLSLYWEIPTTSQFINYFNNVHWKFQGTVKKIDLNEIQHLSDDILLIVHGDVCLIWTNFGENVDVLKKHDVNFGCLIKF